MEIIYNYIISPDRLPLAVLALLIANIGGFLAGPVLNTLNPVFWSFLEGLFGHAASRLNRSERKRQDLVLRGFLLTCFAAFLSFGIGAGLTALAMSYPLSGVTDVVFLVIVLASGSFWKNMMQLHAGLKKENATAKQGAFYVLSKSTRYNLSTADDYTLTRAGIMFSIRHFTKNMVAPVFWYLVGGLPLAYLYSGIAFMSWLIGQRGEKESFGFMANRVERIFGFIPAYLAAFILVLASFFTPTAASGRALRGFFARKNGHSCPYYQGGRPVSVIVWALNLSLGGSMIDYDGYRIKYDWTGPPGSTARLESHHLKRTNYILGVALLIFGLLLLLCMQGAGHLPVN